MLGKLNSARLRTLVKQGTYGDGNGLYLQVRGPENRSWLFRYKICGRARLMGLGVFADVMLAEARDAAAAARKLARQGFDPIDVRKADRAAANAARGLNTFREVAEAYQRAHVGSWRNAKHRWQWSNTLARFVFPVMGHIPVASVTVSEVMRVLESLWHDKPETATRVRGRIETVLDYATARGWRSGENPARWRGHLANLLPARAKVRRVKHHAALPWGEVAAFLAALRGQLGMATAALQFAVLTAARTGEVVGARWGEVDMTVGVWTIPAERMKAGREHRVPLSEPALAVLREVHTLHQNLTSGAHMLSNAFVFPGGRSGRGLSNTAMLMLLRRMKRNDLTVHGFRSTFRDWCAEATAYPANVAEAALAHTIENKIEAAYRRGDLFEKRRQLMADWAAHCTRAEPETAGIKPHTYGIGQSASMGDVPARAPGGPVSLRIPSESPAGLRRNTRLESSESAATTACGKPHQLVAREPIKLPR